MNFEKFEYLSIFYDQFSRNCENEEGKRNDEKNSGRLRTEKG